MNLIQILNTWLSSPNKSFSRKSAFVLDENSKANTITCDCSGLINLLFEQLAIPTPYQIDRPKAVHYYSVLQEIGGNRIDNLQAGHLLAWRKEHLPKSGDTGHVLIVADKPIQLRDNLFQVCVIDSTKKLNGLAKRNIEIQTDKQGKIIGVRLHTNESKVKRIAIYHQSITESRFCFGCGLPKKVCNCGKITPLLIAPPIVILRHHKERKRTLSTVSLIKQRYPNLLVKDGEIFSSLRLSNPKLLFPSNEHEPAIVEVFTSNKILNTQDSDNNTSSTLILVDATWKKAKKIIYLNPWLQALPKASLKPQKISNYLIRKVSKEDELSSLETFASVMQDDALISMFTAFIDHQIFVMGGSTYKNNYQHYLNFDDDKS